MEQQPVRLDFIETRPRSLSIRSDYEYLVYQPTHNYFNNSDTPVTVVMKAHEGFLWNQELFVGQHRNGLGKGYKSVNRQAYQDKIQQACPNHTDDDRVMNLNLSISDKDIFP